MLRSGGAAPERITAAIAAVAAAIGALIGVGLVVVHFWKDIVAVD